MKIHSSIFNPSADDVILVPRYYGLTVSSCYSAQTTTLFGVTQLYSYSYTVIFVSFKNKK